MEEAWALAAGLQPAPTCERDWSATGGHRRDFMVGCPLAAAAAAVLSCRVQSDWWITPHLAVRTVFDCCRWTCRVTQPVQRTPFGPPLGCLLLIRVGRSKSVEVQRVWEAYDERLQFMSRQDALLLDEALGADDVSMAWAVWSRAAESALLDAYRFSGGPLSARVWFLEGVVQCFVLFGFVVIPWRRLVVMLLMCMMLRVFSCIVTLLLLFLLDLRRRFKAVMDVLDAMIRSGISFARSVELTAQLDKILAVGPLYPITIDDLSVVRGMGIGDFHRVVADVHHRLSDFIHAVVVHRRDEAVRRKLNWIREDPQVHPYRWLRPGLVPPAPYLQCKPHLTPGGSGVLADPARIDEEFRKAWLPYFCRSGQRDTSLEEFDFEVEGWLPLLPEVFLPRLTGQVLADVVQRKGAAGSFDGWVWRELKVLPVAWFDGLASILSRVEDLGVWPDGLLDAFIAMIPKTDGDAAPLGQRP